MRGNTFRKRPRSKKRGVKRNKSKKNLKKLMRGGKLEICHFGPNGTITTIKGSDGNAYTLNQLNDHEYETIKTQINILMAVKLEELKPDDIVYLEDSLTLIYAAINNIISNYNFIHLKKHFIHVREDVIDDKKERCKTSLVSIFKNFKGLHLKEDEFEEINTGKYNSFLNYLEKLGKQLDVRQKQLDADLVQLDADLVQLNAQLAQLNAQLAQLDARRRQLTNYRQELNKELPQSNVRRRQELDAELGELNKELGELNKEFGELNKELGKLNPEIPPLNMKIEQLNTQLVQLNETKKIFANLINFIDSLTD